MGKWLPDGGDVLFGLLFGRHCFYYFAFWSALLVGFSHSCVPLFFLEHILLNE